MFDRQKHEYELKVTDIIFNGGEIFLCMEKQLNDH